MKNNIIKSLIRHSERSEESKEKRFFCASRFRMMIFFIFLFLSPNFQLLTLNCCAQDSPDPYRSFGEANFYYKEAKYDEAIAGYEQAAAQGFENGNLYYNLGNAYFKKGELGKAILNYERAKIFIPEDSDLKSNYNYVRELLNLGRQDFYGNWLVRLIDKVFLGIGINLISVFVLLFYSLVFLFFVFLLVFFPSLQKGGRRDLNTTLSFLLSIFLLLFLLSGFGLIRKINYRQKAAIVIAKEAPVKFEPLESATTYFSLSEGSLIEVLESSSGWLKVRRSDGRTGWINEQSTCFIYVDRRKSAEYYGFVAKIPFFVILAKAGIQN